MEQETRLLVVAMIFFAMTVCCIIVIANLLTTQVDLRDKIEKKQMEIDALRRQRENLREELNEIRK